MTGIFGKVCNTLVCGVLKDLVVEQKAPRNGWTKAAFLVLLSPDLT